MDIKLVSLTLSLLLAGQVTGCMASDRKAAEWSDYFDQSATRELAMAACQGDAAGIIRLVGSGVSPNAVGREGYTPLLVAVSCQSEQGVTSLLEVGADPNMRTNGGENSVWIAAGKESTEILGQLLDHGGDMHVMVDGSKTPLIRSLSPSTLYPNFRLLLARGVNVNQANSFGRTAATSAIAYGRPELAIDLMEAGYNYDLVGLAFLAENRAVSSDGEPYVSMLRRILADRGVAWPLPDLLNDEGRIGYMKANPAYALAHPESWPVGHKLHPGIPGSTAQGE